MPEYDYSNIEKKMQQYWEDIDAYKTDDNSDKEKIYVLDMFPYPSGDGLHVGHVEGYTVTDIISRYKTMNGYEVLHPMGWDSFGLPAENYAIKVGTHPRITTDKNTSNFRRQLKSLGFSYDWSREIDTSSEEYYRWSQWFFLFLYKNNLAYRKEAPVNWCDSCQTVLAKAQVNTDGTCERCKNLVKQKNLPQWFFKVTDYAERLLDGLETLDWSDALKEMQRNWIGKSNGASVMFTVKDSDEKIEVFTTRPDTLFGATYMVLAPEHPLVDKITSFEQKNAVEQYVKTSQNRTELERTGTDQQKTGVFTGAFAVNPVNNEQIPIWIADYVLIGYGTGAIMAVPAHDERDFEFATKYQIPIKAVIRPDDNDQVDVDPVLQGKAVYTGEGILMNSGRFDGMSAQEAKRAITAEAKGEMTTSYKIRDWLVSRQRFWGAPIPIVYCEKCGTVPVPEDQLPVKLPKEADFTLHGDGKSPLERVEEFVNTVCPMCSAPAKRETDTMDGFVDNSWYYFRFIDPKNKNVFADFQKIEQWMPIQLYVGGAEHAVGHLIYSRFFTKVLYDHGFIKFEEPFSKLVNQGLILAEDGVKMSKSLGNVINPDEVVKNFGADTLRMFEMFLGPITDSKPWDTKGITGIKRFLEKVWRMFEQDVVRTDAAADDELTASLHRTIKKVTDDIEGLRFNTAIASLMSFVNEVYKKGELPLIEGEVFLKILSPFAPHLAEYLWKELGKTNSITKENWPIADERLLKQELTVVAVQINGKVRDKIEIDSEATEAEAKAKALESETVKRHMEGREIKNVIYVPQRIINFIV